MAVNPVNAPERLSDVVLAVFATDLYEDQTEADARIYYNDIDNPFILNTAVAITKLKAIDAIKQVNIQSLDLLTESEYLRIIECDQVVSLETDSEEAENVGADDYDIFPLASLSTAETSSKRSRRFPKHLSENYLA